MVKENTNLFYMRHYIAITTYAWDAYGMNGGLHDPGGEIITPIIPSYQGDTIEYCGNTVVVNGEVSRVAHGCLQTTILHFTASKFCISAIFPLILHRQNKSKKNGT